MWYSVWGMGYGVSAMWYEVWVKGNIFWGTEYRVQGTRYGLFKQEGKKKLNKPFPKR